jgi:hypothetical protein
MAKQDYVPKGIAAFLDWHDRFRIQLSPIAASLGLPPADFEQVNNDNAMLHTRHAAAEDAKTAQKAAIAAQDAALRAAITNTRAIVTRLRASRDYTDAIGQRLGVIGAEDSTDMTAAKPVLEIVEVMPGRVTIRFVKGGSDGVVISSKRGSEEGFSFLATDTASPYVDTRPNLTSGPETRLYQARYLVGDEPVGLLSDLAMTTVPG